MFYQAALRLFVVAPPQTSSKTTSICQSTSKGENDDDDDKLFLLSPLPVSVAVAADGGVASATAAITGIADDARVFLLLIQNRQNFCLLLIGQLLIVQYATFF